MDLEEETVTIRCRQAAHAAPVAWRYTEACPAPMCMLRHAMPMRCPCCVRAVQAAARGGLERARMQDQVGGAC